MTEYRERREGPYGDIVQAGRDVYYGPDVHIGSPRRRILLFVAVAIILVAVAILLILLL